MPFNRPSLSDLIERAAGDIETRLPGTDARLRRSNISVLARVHAGVVHGLYGFLEWLALQLMPDTAEAEYLERWSSIWGVARKAAATASGSVSFTGTDGSVIPAGTLLQRSDAAEFTTDAEVTIAGGSAAAAVTASLGGADGNTSANSTLNLATPIAGVDGVATVDANGLTGGVDTEADDSLRARLLLRIQQPPHGGAKHDYEAWALEVSDVTRVWVSPNETGLNTVVVRFVVDDHPTSIIPDAAKVQVVQDHIDTVRPVTASITVVAPIAVSLNLTISNLSPNTQAVKDAIQAELKDLLLREAEPGGAILVSHIREAISLAAGETDHLLTAPVADVTHSTGEIAVLGTITWA